MPLLVRADPMWSVGASGVSPWNDWLKMAYELAGGETVFASSRVLAFVTAVPLKRSVVDEPPAIFTIVEAIDNDKLKKDEVTGLWYGPLERDRNRIPLLYLASTGTFHMVSSAVALVVIAPPRSGPRPRPRPHPPSPTDTVSNADIVVPLQHPIDNRGKKGVPLYWQLGAVMKHEPVDLAPRNVPDAE